MSPPKPRCVLRRIRPRRTGRWVGITAIAEKIIKPPWPKLEFARDRAPNDGELLYDLGGLQRAQGKIDQSIASMTKAAALDPLNIRVWTDLAATYEGLRQFDEARSMLDRALAIAPDESQVPLCWKSINLPGTG